MPPSACAPPRGASAARVSDQPPGRKGQLVLHRLPDHRPANHRAEEQAPGHPGSELPRRARPEPAHRCRRGQPDHLNRVTEHRGPGPDRTRVRVKVDQQHREPIPPLTGAGREPAQPTPHRGLRHTQGRGDPPVPLPSGPPDQGSADHRHTVSTTGQHRHRKQHMRDPAARAPRPPRAQPARQTTDRPLPGMTPPNQDPGTTRALQQTLRQQPFDSRRTGTYHQQQGDPSPQRRPSQASQGQGGPSRSQRRHHDPDAGHKRQIAPPMVIPNDASDPPHRQAE